MNITEKDLELTLLQAIRDVNIFFSEENIIPKLSEMLDKLQKQANGQPISSIQTDLELQLDYIYQRLEDDVPNIELIEKLTKETGLESHSEVVRIDTFIDFNTH
jgi:hypothetical protein